MKQHSKSKLWSLAAIAVGIAALATFAGKAYMTSYGPYEPGKPEHTYGPSGTYYGYEYPTNYQRYGGAEDMNNAEVSVDANATNSTGVESDCKCKGGQGDVTTGSVVNVNVTINQLAKDGCGTCGKGDNQNNAVVTINANASNDTSSGSYGGYGSGHLAPYHYQDCTKKVCGPSYGGGSYPKAGGSGSQTTNGDVNTHVAVNQKVG